MENLMNKTSKAFICAAEKKFGKGATLTRSNIDEIVDDSGKIGRAHV